MKQRFFGMNPPPTFGAWPSAGLLNPHIDLLSEAIDSRVEFSGPAHSYVGKGGKLNQSAANAWPLEYSGNIAVGRHLPEPAAVNYMPSSNFESIQAVGTAADWQYSVGNTVQVLDTDFGAKAVLVGSGQLLTGVYSEATNSFVAAAQDSGSPANWTLIKRAFNNANANAIMRWYTARQTSTVYIYGRSVAVPAGDVVASVRRKVDSSGVQSQLAQIEMGKIVTSPIITPQGQSKSRAASSALIREPKAKGATITMSDGTTKDVLSSGGVIQIPMSSSDWGTKYVKSITLR